MEYYILVTKACNLSCSYCSGVNIGSNAAISNEIIEDACSLMLANQQNNNSQSEIIFYGGEPLLAQKEMIKIIKRTKSGNFAYVLHTNGLLLDKIDPYILENIGALFISIDGIPEIHDKYRGQGIFNTLIRNLAQLRPNYNGIILARMTVPIKIYYENEYSLSESVRNIFNYKIFDSVHWQIENSPRHHGIEEIEAFNKGYSTDIEGLVHYWISHLQQGVNLNIVPIQTTAIDLLNVNKDKKYPCGCNERLVVIDIDGDCYLCDELIGIEEFIIGNVKKGISFSKDYQCDRINENCASCEYIGICGGRCLNSCLLFPKDMFYFYCNATKLLIDAINKRLPEIKGIMTRNIITNNFQREGIPIPGCYISCTERRP